MKYILTFILLFTVSFAQQKYDYGNIDMHGGKKAPLLDNNKKFSNLNMETSIFLNTKKKKESKKITKVKEYK